MSWLFSRALVEAYSADTSLDGAPCALSSGTPTPQASWLPARTTEHYRLSQSGMTFKPLTAGHGEAVLTSFLEGFPAKTSALPARAQESTDSGPPCGSTWRESLVRYDLATRSWRTHRCLWDEALPESSATLPRWGMMRGGVCWERTTLTPLTSATDSGSWLPTPTAKANMMAPSMQKWPAHRNLWPTPQASEARQGFQDRSNGKKGSQKSLTTIIQGAPKEQAGGTLNPTWVEWLMGWPLEWTACDASATDKYQQWRQQHGGCSDE